MYRNMTPNDFWHDPWVVGIACTILGAVVSAYLDLGCKVRRIFTGKVKNTVKNSPGSVQQTVQGNGNRQSVNM